jgi:protein subunit release factor A
VESVPEDVRIDVARMVDGGPCAVRVTHTPTGTTVQVDDQASTDANRDLALDRLREKLSGL